MRRHEVDHFGTILWIGQGAHFTSNATFLLEHGLSRNSRKNSWNCNVLQKRNDFTENISENDFGIKMPLINHALKVESVPQGSSGLESQVRPSLALFWPWEQDSDLSAVKQQISIVAIHKFWCSLSTLSIGTEKFPQPPFVTWDLPCSQHCSTTSWLARTSLKLTVMIKMILVSNMFVAVTQKCTKTRFGKLHCQVNRCWRTCN